METGFPFALNAELTHRCPLLCPYCSNPAELTRREHELTTAQWIQVLDEAARLGVLQVHMTGGEPLLRDDLEILVQKARELDMYVNLITSGVGLTERRIRKLSEAGLDSIQLSIQAADPELADSIAGRPVHGLKQQAAHLIRTHGYPLHMNVVLHRQNLFQVGQIIDLCVSWGAKRLELANAQYYGWALMNRDFLLPDRAELAVAEEIYEQAKQKYGDQIELIWVLPDYYEEFPKPCMGGWGKISLTVAPDGKALPCPAASSIRTLHLENVKEKSLEWIWRNSPSFQAYRGYDWMMEPCRSCERRDIDYGGCRCQAFLLTNDAAQPDPVCSRSPWRKNFTERLAAAAASAGANGSDFRRRSLL
jgi:pyrroloquinoline quinone biosynthesis protein E